MATFYVTLEDVSDSPFMFAGHITSNRRFETIDAVDIDAAWAQARSVYYSTEGDPVVTQIVDITTTEPVIPPQVVQAMAPIPPPVIETTKEPADGESTSE